MIELQIKHSYVHLWQIFTGISLLRDTLFTELKVCKIKSDSLENLAKPICILKINGVRLAYDTLDGYNFLDGRNRTANLQYLDKLLDEVDVYFKRSYAESIHGSLRNKAKILPLGLNYHCTEDSQFIQQAFCSAFERLAYRFKTLLKPAPHYRLFEEYPCINKEVKILFLTRLWENEGRNEEQHAKRAAINQSRIDCIRACHSVFGDRFFGGLQDNALAKKLAPDLIVDHAVSKRKHYIDRMKSSDICIATTGLHDSIGWKMGEYVAASRAIVSEELLYTVPYGFEKNKNYNVFHDALSLIDAVQNLVNDREKCRDMMMNNYCYYHSFLKPDSMVLNSLFAAEKMLDRTLV